MIGPAMLTMRRGYGGPTRVPCMRCADASNKEADVTDTGRSEPHWFKSSRSTGGDCVEVAFVGDDVWVRDSKDPNGPMLKFSRESWRVFIADLPQRDR
jgi:hypothetical protein